MTYGTYSMYDNQVSRHNNGHFTPYQKPMSFSGRQMNSSGMYYPTSSNYQQHMSPQYNYQQSPPMAMGQMQPVQIQQPFADRQFGFNPVYNSMGVPKQNMVPMTSPVLNQLTNQQSQPQQQRQLQQHGHPMSQQTHQHQFYSQSYAKQQSYSPMMNKHMAQPAQSKSSSYLQFPKMPVAVQSQSATPPAKFQTPTIGQMLGVANKKMKKFNTRDTGILHEFFNLNPSISELAKRAERIVMEMEKKSKLPPMKKNVAVRKEFQQSVSELSGGPIRLNTRHQQAGYVPYKESVVPATPSPSSSHSQFSPLCSDFNSPSPSNALQSSYF